MELYESRIASMQRFVSMCVIFHQMGSRVQTFFPKMSFGLLGYNMDRTHSIMRIATTASPVSGADVRDRMAHLAQIKVVESSAKMIADAWRAYKKAKTERIVREFHSSQGSLNWSGHSMRTSSKMPDIDESQPSIAYSPQMSPRAAPKLSAFSRKSLSSSSHDPSPGPLRPPPLPTMFLSPSVVSSEEPSVELSLRQPLKKPEHFV